MLESLVEYSSEVINFTAAFEFATTWWLWLEMLSTKVTRGPETIKPIQCT